MFKYFANARNNVVGKSSLDEITGVVYKMLYKEKQQISRSLKTNDERRRRGYVFVIDIN